MAFIATLRDRVDGDIYDVRLVSYDELCRLQESAEQATGGEFFWAARDAALGVAEEAALIKNEYDRYVQRRDYEMRRKFND